MKTYRTNKYSGQLFLIRHGKSAYSHRFEDRGLVEVHGQLLTETNSLITLAAQTLLNRINGSDCQLITSPKRRCWQTAELLLAVLEPQFEISISVNEGFRDVDVIRNGNYRPNGGSYGDWEANLKEGQNWLDGWHQSHRYYPGEESPTELYNRVKQALLAIIANNSFSQPIIIVCHEEVMLAIAQTLEIKVDRPTYAEIWEING